MICFIIIYITYLLESTLHKTVFILWYWLGNTFVAALASEFLSRNGSLKPSTKFLGQISTGTTEHVFISWILFRPYFLSRSSFTKIYLGKGCNVTLNQVLNSKVKIMANQLWPLWSRTLWDGHHLQVIVV